MSCVTNYTVDVNLAVASANVDVAISSSSTNVDLDSNSDWLTSVGGRLLDNYDDASAAYSFRKLRGDYTGPCVSVAPSGGVIGMKLAGGEAGYNGGLRRVGYPNFSSTESGRVYAEAYYDAQGLPEGVTHRWTMRFGYTTSANQGFSRNVELANKQWTKIFFDNPISVDSQQIELYPSNSAYEPQAGDQIFLRNIQAEHPSFSVSYDTSGWIPIPTGAEGEIVNSYDIGFDSNGDLKEDDIVKFSQLSGDAYSNSYGDPAASDLAVSKWYDQAGSNDAIGPTDYAERPKIHDASTGVVKHSAKPAIYFDGTNDYLRSGQDLLGTFSVFGVQSFYDLDGGQLIGRGDGNTTHLNRAVFGFNALNQVFLYRGGAVATVSDALTPDRYLIHGLNTPSQTTCLVGANGSSHTGVNNIGPGEFRDVVIGAELSAVSFYGRSEIQEIVIFPSDKTSSRLGIEDNISRFYSIEGLELARPSKSVDISNVSNFETLQAQVDVDLNGGVVKSQSVNIDLGSQASDVFVDVSGASFEASICPLKPLGPFTFEINTTNLAYDNYDYYRGTNQGVLTSSLAGNTFPTSDYALPSATPSSDALVISSDSNQYTLPTVEGGEYNFKVIWGDGYEDYITEWDDPKITHTYQDAGSFLIRIDGVFHGLNFHHNTATGHFDGLKVTNIVDWGSDAQIDLGSYVVVYKPERYNSPSYKTAATFHGCKNLIITATEPPKFGVTNHQRANLASGHGQTGRELAGSGINGGLFSGCVNLQGNLRKWGTPEAPIVGDSYNQFQYMWNATPDLAFHWDITGQQYLAFATTNNVRNADNTGNQTGFPGNFSFDNWRPKPDVSQMQYLNWIIGAPNLNPDLSSLVTNQVTRLRNTFERCTSMEGHGVENWDVSNVHELTECFQNCTSFNGLVSNWQIKTDPSIQVDMPNLFTNCHVFDQRLDMWDVSNVRNAGRLVRDCDVFNNGGHSWTNADWSNNTAFTEMFRRSAFNQDISEWIMPSVPFSLYFAFANCPFNQPIDTHTDESGETYWDVSNCTNLRGVFYENEDFNQPLDSWDVSNVTSIREAFLRAYSFNQPLNSWDTSSVTDMYQTFARATSFNQDLSNWDVSNVTTFDRMFQNATSFNGEVGTWTINTNEPVYMGGIFYHTPHLFDGQDGRGGDLSGWDTSQVTSMIQMFYNSSLFRRQYWQDEDPSLLTEQYGNNFYFPNWSPGVGGWDTGNVTNFNNMFFQAGTFNDDISGWNVSKNTSFNRFLKSCFKFDRDLSSWSLNTDPSANVNLHEMFFGCVEFNNGGSAGIDNWDTSRVSDMGEMFRGCSVFNQPIGSWDTSNVTDMQFMFSGANAFNQDISNWDTSSVTNMINMFLSADAFNQDLSSWDLSSVTNIASMFDGTTMSKANLDTTIQGWCANANTPSGLSIGKIPLNGTTELLDSATISAMTAKGMTGTYNNLSAIY